MGIVIFSRPIHSGKTTALMNWCRLQTNVQGILMPDVNGQRMFFDIVTRQMFPAECLDNAKAEAVITIGKYHFFADAFIKANTILMSALTLNPEWLVVDEIGKLELQNKGLYESAKLIIEHYKKCNERLLLVVRTGLVDEVVNFFGIMQFDLIDKL